MAGYGSWTAEAFLMITLDATIVNLALPAMTSVAMGAVPDRPGLAAGVLIAARRPWYQ